jgi:hypothetical protein
MNTNIPVPKIGTFETGLKTQIVGNFRKVTYGHQEPRYKMSNVLKPALPVKRISFLLDTQQ